MISMQCMHDYNAAAAVKSRDKHRQKPQDSACATQSEITEQVPKSEKSTSYTALERIAIDIDNGRCTGTEAVERVMAYAMSEQKEVERCTSD